MEEAKMLKLTTSQKVAMYNLTGEISDLFLFTPG